MSDTLDQKLRQMATLAFFSTVTENGMMNNPSVHADTEKIIDIGVVLAKRTLLKTRGLSTKERGQALEKETSEGIRKVILMYRDS